MKDSKILIVEDEQIIAENLRFILNEYGYNFVDVAMDAEETAVLFQDTSYDLVLMDINLGEFSTIDGIDLIKKLFEKYTFVFMYVTANADEKTVEKAKNTHPVGYIIKPFINTSIYANVEMALSRVQKEEFLIYTNKGMQYQVLLSKVTYIQADGAYINIHTSDNSKHFVRKTLTEISELYPTVFIRIHKSIVINKNYIQSYTSNMVKVNDEKLPLGRTYKSYFLAQAKSHAFS